MGSRNRMYRGKDEFKTLEKSDVLVKNICIQVMMCLEVECV